MLYVCIKKFWLDMASRWRLGGKFVSNLSAVPEKVGGIAESPVSFIVSGNSSR